MLQDPPPRHRGEHCDHFQKRRVRGADKGGILVRQGQALSSPEVGLLHGYDGRSGSVCHVVVWSLEQNSDTLSLLVFKKACFTTDNSLAKTCLKAR